MTRRSSFRFPAFVLLALALTFPPPHRAGAQPRSLAQDSTLDNLRHPPGTGTAAWGTLGGVVKSGDGPRTMILIPGIGFGGGVWDEFAARRDGGWTVYAVTLPGFGGTPPLPMPASDTSYAQTPWIRSAVRAIGDLIEREGIGKATVVAHWALATQVALQLAAERPDLVEGVVLAAGVLKSYYENSPEMLGWNASQRARFADGMGGRWFRTVTRTTWDDNNFMAYDYAVNPRRGLFLWREAAAPSLPVWIRYLLEFYSLDQSELLRSVRVPVLVVRPGFDDPGFYVEEGRNYMRNLCIDSWRGVDPVPGKLEFTDVPGSRLFIWHDRPGEFDRAIDGFLNRLER